MAFELTAKRVSTAVEEGFNRLAAYRGSRAMFIKDYVGNYFCKPKGMTGEYPINLIFLALRALIPNLIAKHGVNKIITDILAHKDFAELLGLGLDKSQKQRKLKNTLRAGLVDMCFGLATFKTSVAASGELLPVGDDINEDPGQIYTDLISFDDLVIDPACRSREEATFIGHNIRIPRLELLEQDFKEEFVRALPSAASLSVKEGKIQKLSMENANNQTMYELQDFVNVVELWIPDANAVCYIPNPYQTSFDDFLKITDYYGPAEGPYTFGALTPPVPDNPLPVAPVGVWRDLNEIANRIFKKFMEQSDRQKDVMLFKPAYADVAEAVRTAVDGDTIACDDPSTVQTLSIGGQNSDNEKMISQLQVWFNYMAGNPDQMSGLSSSARTGKATEVQILQANASVVTEDMRDIIADVNADISKKEAWFMMNDPLIKIPLTKRETGGREIQLWLTPEQQQGDFAEYAFSIVKRSMQIMEPALRQRAVREFYTNVCPSVATSAQICMQLGVPFNVPRALMQAAEEMGIEDVVLEIFDDPTFSRRMEMFAALGPKDVSGKQPLNVAGIRQNQGSPMARPILTPGQEFNRQAQSTAAIGQSAWGGR